MTITDPVDNCMSFVGMLRCAKHPPPQGGKLAANCRFLVAALLGMRRGVGGVVARLEPCPSTALPDLLSAKRAFGSQPHSNVAKGATSEWGTGDLR